MEWIFILIGIAYSIYSSIKKEAKAREEKLRQTVKSTGKITPQRAADQMFARGSNRRTLGAERDERDINTVQAARAYGTDVSSVQELSVEDIQEDFTTRLNRKLMERGAQPALRRSISEVFGDLTLSENQRVVDYDDIATYDDRAPSYDDRTPNYDDRAPKYSTEHESRSHFKLNEGLRKDSFHVGKMNAFDELDLEQSANAPKARVPIKFDAASLKQYVIMHEVLGKPRAIEKLRRGLHRS
jgi:hypothetical protein